MSDILENIKDAINPSRREEATPPDYDPNKRGAYADAPSDDKKAQVNPPAKTAVDQRAQTESVKTAPDVSSK